MGCGKTTVGKALAKRLGWEFLDTDEVIVGRYGPISEIFSVQGEEYFRDLETEIAKEIEGHNEAVVSVGGGFVLRKENVDSLKQGGKIVLLSAKKETLQKRLEGDTSRPLLQGKQLSLRLEELLKKRLPVYESVCDAVVSVEDCSPEEIADKIAEMFGL